jgi:multidrug efflux pump subunit AcrA (membrane-fusion protein)
MNPSSNRRPLFWIFALALVLGAIYWVSKSGAANPDQRIGKVKRENLVQSVTIAGTAEPVRSTVFNAPYDGYIKKLYVKLGDKVQAGAPLLSVAQSLQVSENVFPMRAPFTGVITQVMKSEGQFARQTDPKDIILRLDDLTKMFINSNVPEIDVVKIKSGLEAVIKVSAIINRTYKGVVRDISRAANPKEQWGRSQVDYLSKIEILDADAQLLPGMTAVVDIVTNKKENVLTLPHEFIQKEDDEYFVILKDGSRRDIKVGLQNESVFEITAGLSEGQEVQQVDFLKLIEKKK